MTPIQTSFNESIPYLQLFSLQDISVAFKSLIVIVVSRIGHEMLGSA